MVNVLHLHTDLRSAIDSGKMVVYYQPILDMKTEKTVGLEALIRWRVSESKIIAPGNFIGIAEETGLILPIGSIVVESVCEQLKVWSAFCPKLPYVSINVSLKQFGDPKHIKSLVKTIQNSGLDPKLFKFEVTESVIMDNPQGIAKDLMYLKDCGFTLSIDDFGTGYSSLSYLHKFPFDDLKIDRSFISRITYDPKSYSVVNGIIGLADDLGLNVVAEGISSKEELTILQSMNCPLGQGYLFAEPNTPEKILHHIHGAILPVTDIVTYK
jgi:EAL domain-containing protein (putative c-di-GMP-specific phosphodiesterase class I)